MNTIWKYELQITDVQTLSVPVGARPLKVGSQEKDQDKISQAQLDEGWRLVPLDALMIWLQVDPEAELIDVVFRVIGTGHKFDPAGLWHWGTTDCNGYIWHVFMEAGL